MEILNTGSSNILAIAQRIIIIDDKNAESIVVDFLSKTLNKGITHWFGEGIILLERLSANCNYEINLRCSNLIFQQIIHELYQKKMNRYMVDILLNHVFKMQINVISPHIFISLCYELTNDINYSRILYLRSQYLNNLKTLSYCYKGLKYYYPMCCLLYCRYLAYSTSKIDVIIWDDLRYFVMDYIDDVADGKIEYEEIYMEEIYSLFLLLKGRMGYPTGLVCVHRGCSKIKPLISKMNEKLVEKFMDLLR